jgi:hypothetical protein
MLLLLECINGVNSNPIEQKMSPQKSNSIIYSVYICVGLNPAEGRTTNLSIRNLLLGCMFIPLCRIFNLVLYPGSSGVDTLYAYH